MIIARLFRKKIKAGVSFRQVTPPFKNSNNAGATYILEGKARFEKTDYMPTEYGSSRSRTGGGFMYSNQLVTVTALEDMIFVCFSLMYGEGQDEMFQIKEKLLEAGEVFSVDKCSGGALIEGEVTIDGDRFTESNSFQTEEPKTVTFEAHAPSTVTYIVSREV